MRLSVMAALAVIAITVATACNPDKMAHEDCGVLLDHLVDLKLTARGFHDPALATRRKQELRRLFRADLDRCARIPRDQPHVACVLDTRSTPELWTRCLRRTTASTRRATP